MSYLHTDFELILHAKQKKYQVHFLINLIYLPKIQIIINFTIFASQIRFIF